MGLETGRVRAQTKAYPRGDARSDEPVISRIVRPWFFDDFERGVVPSSPPVFFRRWFTVCFVVRVAQFARGGPPRVLVRDPHMRGTASSSVRILMHRGFECRGLRDVGTLSGQSPAAAVRTCADDIGIHARITGEGRVPNTGKLYVRG